MPFYDVEDGIFADSEVTGDPTVTSSLADGPEGPSVRACLILASATSHPLGWEHILFTGEYRWPRILNAWSVISPSTGVDPFFDDEARKMARDELPEDIPRLLSEKGEGIRMTDFWTDIYKQTPAHSDDINHSIFANSDMEVLTPKGNPRRAPHTITFNDIIRLKRQRQFHFMSGRIPPKPSPFVNDS